MKIKVFNENIHDYSEKYQDDVITIPAGGFVEMDEDDAIAFLGQYTPPKLDGQDRPDPRFFKKLRREYAPIVDADSLVNHADGKKAGSPEELRAMMSTFAHMLQDQAAGKEDVKLKKLVKENKALKDRLSAIEAKLGLNSEEPAAPSAPLEAA